MSTEQTTARTIEIEVETHNKRAAEFEHLKDLLIAEMLKVKALEDEIKLLRKRLDNESEKQPRMLREMGSVY